MEDGLGALGFWVFLGLIVAAGTVSEALKQRDKERERQAMLRALLEKDGNSVTEVLAYLRERDAADSAAAAAAIARETAIWRRVGKGLKWLALGILVFGGGILAFAVVRVELLRGEGSVLLPLVAMFATWAVGLIIVRRMWRSGKQTDDAHPGA